jgi:glycine cleavage system transcriptional repressor
MRKRFIVTAFGEDRPGIIADVSGLIFENGCNLEDSTMTTLSDEFAMIFLVEGPEEKQGRESLERRLSRECRRLEKEKGISAFVRPIKSAVTVAKKEVIPEILHVEGLDQAGIVYKICRCLGDRNINISSFASRMSRLPETGAALYTIDIRIEIPEGVIRESLEESLMKIADELNVDISIGSDKR